MPKIKLRGWQFDLMRDALIEKALKENQEVYRIACNFLNEESEYSEDEAERVMIAAMNKISDEIRRCVAEKNEILSEDEKDDNESPEYMERHNKREKSIETIITQKDMYESLINDIIRRRTIVREQRNIIKVLEKKSKFKDFIKYYDDDAILDSECH